MCSTRVTRWPPTATVRVLWAAGVADMNDRSSNTGCLAGGGAIYGLGIFGAWVYFWQQAEGFWEYVGAILQGFVWPAFMVYDIFEALSR